MVALEKRRTSEVLQEQAKISKEKAVGANVDLLVVITVNI